MTRLSALLICLLPTMATAANDFTCHSEYVQDSIFEGLRDALAERIGVEPAMKAIGTLNPKLVHIVVAENRPDITAFDCAAGLNLNTQAFNWDRLQLASAAQVGGTLELAALYGVLVLPDARPDHYTKAQAAWDSLPYRVQRSSDGRELLVAQDGFEGVVNWMEKVYKAGALDPTPLPKQKIEPAFDSSAEAQKWSEKLLAHIQPQINPPPSLPPGLSTQAQITITRKGTVTDVRTIRSSGNKALDEAVVRAIAKASPLPLPDDSRAFTTVLKPTFRSD